MAVKSHDITDLNRILGVLAQDQGRLDHARERFEKSPGTSQSGTTTRGPSLTPPVPEEQKRIDDGTRILQLEDRRSRARPVKQFEDQIFLEQRREWRQRKLGDPRTMMSNFFLDEARKKVKESWVKQGIWADGWRAVACDNPPYVWKHELASPTAATEELAASRPISQFCYQLQRECEKLPAEEAEGSQAVGWAPDINTRAYDRVRDRWTQLGYWNEKWDTLPGMTWLYEDPLDDECIYGLQAAESVPGDEEDRKTVTTNPTRPSRRKRPAKDARVGELAAQGGQAQRRSPRLSAAKQAGQQTSQDRTRPVVVSSDIEKRLPRNGTRKRKSGRR